MQFGSHLLKLDPDKQLSESRMDIILKSQTQGLIFGGTQGVTKHNMSALMEMTSSFKGARFMEVTSEEVALPGCDAYLVPVVLNSPDSRWIIGEHGRGLRKLWRIPWERILPVGYLVLNPFSAVANKTGVIDRETDIETLIGLMQAANRLFKISTIYIEYSGVFGDPNVVAALCSISEPVHLIYGGGIKTAWQALTMKKLCDTIVIGNYLYDCAENELDSVLLETYLATKK